MNRQDKVKEIARQEAIAAAWKENAARLRAEVEAEAKEEFEANGNGITWNFRDLGKVTMPLSTEAPVVADIDALLKWCKERHPENVETVEQVRAAYQTWLLGNAKCDGDLVVHPGTGEVIPGMAVRQGGQPKALTITVDRDVKALYANYAKQAVADQLAAEYGAAEVRCTACGVLIHDGDPIEMVGDGYAHVDCPRTVA